VRERVRVSEIETVPAPSPSVDQLGARRPGSESGVGIGIGIGIEGDEIGSEL
jgi:hypothetical protein